MRRTAFACLCLALSGCGYNTWYRVPFVTGPNVNAPVSDAENMSRVMGHDVQVQPLTPEPGDVWPGPLPPEPTLQDLEQQYGSGAGGIEQPDAGSPLSRQQMQQLPQQQNAPSLPPLPPNRGSSTPPGSVQSPVPTLPNPQTPTAIAPVTPPQQRNPAGQIVQTPRGPNVTTGGTSGYQTLTEPGGGSSIVVPNGNGTSTIIRSDGRIETVPTPR